MPKSLLDPHVEDFGPLPRVKMSWPEVSLLGGLFLVMFLAMAIPAARVYGTLGDPFVRKVGAGVIAANLAYVAAIVIYVFVMVLILHATHGGLIARAFRRRNDEFRRACAPRVKEIIDTMHSRSFRLLELQFAHTGYLLAVIGNPDALGIPFSFGELDQAKAEFRPIYGPAFLRFSRPYFVPIDFTELVEEQPVFGRFEWGTYYSIDLQSPDNPRDWPSQGLLNPRARDAESIR